MLCPTPTFRIGSDPWQPSAPASSPAVSALHLGPLRIVRINWGADVSVGSEHPGAIGINIPLRGELETVIDGPSGGVHQGLRHGQPG